jgi:hypothetical protein
MWDRIKHFTENGAEIWAEMWKKNGGSLYKIGNTGVAGPGKRKQVNFWKTCVSKDVGEEVY